MKNNAKKEKIYYRKGHLDFYDSVKQNEHLDSIFATIIKDGTRGIALKKDLISPGLSFDLKPIVGKTGLTIKASARVYFSGIPSGDIIITIQDKNGKTLKWDSKGFDRFLPVTQGWVTLDYKIGIDKIDPSADKIKVILWNTGQQDIYASGVYAEITGY